MHFNNIKNRHTACTSGPHQRGIFRDKPVVRFEFMNEEWVKEQINIEGSTVYGPGELGTRSGDQATKICRIETSSPEDVFFFSNAWADMKEIIERFESATKVLTDLNTFSKQISEDKAQDFVDFTKQITDKVLEVLNK